MESPGVANAEGQSSRPQAFHSRVIRTILDVFDARASDRSVCQASFSKVSNAAIPSELHFQGVIFGSAFSDIAPQEFQAECGDRALRDIC
jgi:hypothetical protein